MNALLHILNLQVQLNAEVTEADAHHGICLSEAMTFCLESWLLFPEFPSTPSVRC